MTERSPHSGVEYNSAQSEGTTPMAWQAAIAAGIK